MSVCVSPQQDICGVFSSSLWSAVLMIISLGAVLGVYTSQVHYMVFVYILGVQGHSHQEQYL